MWQSRVIVFRFTPDAVPPTIRMPMAEDGRARGSVLASLQTPSVSECIIKHNYRKFFSLEISRFGDRRTVILNVYFYHRLGHRDGIKRRHEPIE